MSASTTQIIPKLSLIVVLNSFEPDILIQDTKSKEMDFNIWSSAPFELLEIYYCFPSFFAVGFTKTIKDFKIDGNTVILQDANPKVFTNPWSIIPEMMNGMTAKIDLLQKIYTKQRMQFIIEIANASGGNITENMYWYLVIRATTAQQFKVSVNMLG